MSPLFKSFAEDRLADLFGARRAHRSLVLVEAQARLLELQAAILEQPPHLRGSIGDHVLVEHPMHTPGQHRVEVRHEGNVVAIGTPQIFEAVREALTAREVLLEAGEAATKWVAPGVDDARIRQDQLNEANIEPVIRHLVDKEGPGTTPHQACACQIAFAEIA